jgi:flagellar motility protein MotE (MotC chaperone)
MIKLRLPTLPTRFRLFPAVTAALGAVLVLKLIEVGINPAPAQQALSQPTQLQPPSSPQASSPLPPTSFPEAPPAPPRLSKSQILDAVRNGINPPLPPNPAFDAAAETGTDPIVTGTAQPAPKTDAAAPAAGSQPPAEPNAPTNRSRISSERPAEATVPAADTGQRSEAALLERLGERRRELDERERQLALREQLLKATESRIDKRVDELKALEESIGTAQTAKEEARVKELADLVKMYEGMKAKDAARVFDRLDTVLLTEIAKQMNPRKLGDVVARMDPEAAEKLTIALARSKSPAMATPVATAQPAPPAGGPRELPKIEGKTTP